MSNDLWKEFERWVGKEIFNGAKRNIGSGAINTRDDNTPRTGDVIHPTWEIECKLRKYMGVFTWWRKLAGEAKSSGKQPVLFMREKGNKKDVLAVIHYKDFIEYMKLKGAVENE